MSYKSLLFQFFRKLKLISANAFLLLFSCFGVFAFGQVSSYDFGQTMGTYTPITGGTVLATATGNSGAASLDTAEYPATLPFGFVFNGAVFNTVNVSSNGYLTLGGTDPSSTASNPLAATSNWDGVIAAWARDINAIYDVNGVTSDIRIETLGAAPNRIAVIQWSKFRALYNTSTTNVYQFSFQIRLKETSNEIEVVYDKGSFVIGSLTNTGVLFVGLRGKTNLDFNSRKSDATQGFDNSVAATLTTQSQAMSLSASSPNLMPSTGLTYKWSPGSCLGPLNGNFTNVTYNSGTANWVAPVGSPQATYDLYYSTSSTAPTGTTTPNFSNISGTSQVISTLQSVTTYYVWVRTNCTTVNKSQWIALPPLTTTCQSASVFSSTGATVCPGAAATLTASTSSGAVINWYGSATTGAQLATGNSYTTPQLSSTTNYWVSASTGTAAAVGKSAPTATDGNTGFNDVGLMFDVLANTIIKSVDVYPMGSASSGTITVALKNSAGTLLQSKTFPVDISSGGTLNVLALDFPISAGTGYRMVITGQTGLTYLRRDSSASTFTYPYTLPGELSITSAFTGGASSSSYYYYFYNWKVGNKCESARIMVTATVDAAGCLATAEVAQKENFKIHPNPFTDFVNIQNVDKVKSISVIDATGRVVKSNIKVSESINLSDLKSGMYLLNLELKDGSKVSHKIMKK